MSSISIEAAARIWALEEPEGDDLGAEILDSSAEFVGGPIGGTMDNAGCFAGLEFIGDVGRDPLGDHGLND